MYVHKILSSDYTERRTRQDQVCNKPRQRRRWYSKRRRTFSKRSSVWCEWDRQEVMDGTMQVSRDENPAKNERVGRRVHWNEWTSPKQINHNLIITDAVIAKNACSAVSGQRKRLSEWMMKIYQRLLREGYSIIGDTRKSQLSGVLLETHGKRMEYE